MIYSLGPSSGPLKKSAAIRRRCMSVSEDKPLPSSSLVVTDASEASKRSHQVKVTLNQAELELLDNCVAHLGSDRSSTFRHLLHLFSSSSVTTTKRGDREVIGKSQLNDSLDLVTQSDKVSIEKIVFIEPEKFQDGKLRQAMNCIANNTPVIAGLSLMEADQAQRAVDYLAGATEGLKGHCERIAQSTFLFTPSGIPIEVGDSDAGSKVDQIDSVESAQPLLTGSAE